jgi:hypothetical protein
MTVKHLMELVKRHDPSISEKELILRLNNASRSFCQETNINQGAWTFSTAVDQRYYPIADNIVQIDSVDYDGYDIPKLTGRPEKRDIT